MIGRRLLASLALSCALGSSAAAQVELVIVDPGHFHASLIQKFMYPQVSPRVSVYAPLTGDLMEYLARVAQFNSRNDDPTRWELEIHTGAGAFDRMLRDRPGNVVVFAGRNREKIGRILRSIEAGFNVLADKPWIIASEDLPKLAKALDTAAEKGLVAYDIMTERHEITSILQKEIVNDPAVFGRLVPGSAREPGITARSIHYLSKTVAGVPLRRPTWFLDIEETGEGMADVGTHVIDLVQWVAFPSTTVDYRSDVRMLEARRWPTVLSKAQFAKVTGEPEFPAHLAKWVNGDRLDYYSNHAVHYTVRGVHVALDIQWGWEAAPGTGDLYEATFRGTRSRAEIRQRKDNGFQPELYIVPATPGLRDETFSALRAKIESLRKSWPGIAVEARDGEAHIAIPDRLRVGHEAHFGEVTREFLGYLKDAKTLPPWEKSNMLVKYYISTKGVELSRRR